MVPPEPYACRRRTFLYAPNIFVKFRAHFGYLLPVPLETV